MNLSPPAFDNESVLSRMNRVLNYKMDQRCADLAVLFDIATKQDLQTIFPILVDHIFGPQGTYSWCLRSILNDIHYCEFTNVMSFLKPQGALFKLIYILLQDPNVKYDFSLAFLPFKIRQMLDASNVHPFYNEIVQYTMLPNGRQPVSLLLNPFDYYIFHFAYHLINPCQQRVSSEDQWNSAYYNLCAEYLLHFFPVGTDNVILPLIGFYHGKNPMQTIQNFHRPHRHSPLLKSNIFGDPQIADVKIMHQHLEKHPRNEIWRSETLLMAIVDFWLTNDQVCTQFDTAVLNTSIYSSYPELPSGDYIRIVRIAVKHLHAFTSTAAIDTSPLGELRKHTMPMMQSRMYVFLKNLLYRWPLDESFRLVLELWLSFIQPWRYSHDLYTQRGGIYKSSSTQVLPNQTDPKQADGSYMPFIAENFLVYVVILQHLLPRFSRIDLASPRNAQMLFRLTKVFNQPNLVPMLKTIEWILEANIHHVNPLNCSSILPPSSPTKANVSQMFTSTQINLDSSKLFADASAIFNSTIDNLSSKYLNVVWQKIRELEGSQFSYKPLFLNGGTPEVYELLNLVKSSELKAVGLLMETKERQQKNLSFWASIMQNFNFCEDIGEVSVQDRHKAPVFLKHSADNLIEIFNISNFDNFDVTAERAKSFSASEDSGSGISSNGFNSQILTPNRVRERVKNAKFEGDPDLMPIQSYEIAFLVRLFYTLSQNLNNKYGEIISNLYHNTGFIGNISHNFLQGPKQIYKYEKSAGVSKRQMYNLPPRVSFRPLANRQLLYFLSVGTLFTYYILKCHLFTFPFLYLIWCLFKIMWRSVFFTTRPRSNVCSFQNAEISFNDSLDD